MEFMTINGQPVEVPEKVRELSLKQGGPGRAAVEQWYAEQDAPHAREALAKSGLKASDVTCTGFGGGMLTSDVQRAVLAKEAEKAAAAEAAEAAKSAKPSATTAPGATPTDAAPKES
jgi:pyruvate/2-oxoglutarate dehydrogenase complex dihydrolipoamide acyltransferase (E2) component